MYLCIHIVSASKDNFSKLYIYYSLLQYEILCDNFIYIISSSRHVAQIDAESEKLILHVNRIEKNKRK